MPHIALLRLYDRWPILKKFDAVAHSWNIPSGHAHAWRQLDWYTLTGHPDAHTHRHARKALSNVAQGGESWA